MGLLQQLSVLEEIADQFKGQVKIIVDGGIRSGLDVFKAPCF